MTLFSSPAWLSLFALDARGDSDLRDGVHVRLLPSPLLGLPIAPWLIWQVPVSTHTLRVFEKQQPGSLTVPIDLAEAERGGTCHVAVEAVTALPDAKLSISLVDPGSGRVLSRRSQRPYIVGGPTVRQVLLEGDIEGVMLKIHTLYTKLLDGSRDQPIASLALPVTGDCRWHAGGAGQEEGLERVRRGAPLRRTPLERPDGPLDPLTPEDEAARVSATLAEVEAALEQVVRDPREAPWDVTLHVDQPGIGGEGPQRAEIPQFDSVALASCDPGFARYLGFADNLGKAIRAESAKPLPGLIGAGLFAVDPERVLSEWKFGPFEHVVRLGDRLPPLEAGETAMIERIIKLTGAEGVARKLQSDGFQLRCFLAPAAAVPPPDPPPAPEISLGEAHWIAGPDGVSTTFRQGFRLLVAPFAPLLAMARRAGGGRFEPRARVVDTGTGPRRVPLLTGCDREGRGIVSDAPVPGGPPSIYRFHVGDLFGRFGSPTDINAPEPRRPALPAPTIRSAVHRAALSDQAGGQQSPGTLEVCVPVPGPESISAGGRRIKSLTLVFAGQQQTADAPPGSLTFARFPLPPLLPHETGRWPLTARFGDEGGQVSPDATETVEVTDGRRPQPVPAGPGIVWTNRPGPSPEVHLRLSWPATPGQRYRVWMADQRSLGLEADPSRAVVALDGFGRQEQGKLHGLADRFRQLTGTPITADGDGRARFEAALPRALRTVSFLRVVPVTEENVEADFDACPLVPVAVPDDRRPPIPRLTATVGASGRPTLKIEATGFDLTAIRAAEPGLFADQPTPALHPEYRLRRASGPVNDPLYARMLTPPRPLALEGGATPRFAASFEDTSALLPFVRYTWWVEVRLPAERRLPPLQDSMGATPLPGAITAEDPAGTKNAARAFSLISPPATLVNALGGPPPPPGTAKITASVERGNGAHRLRLAIADVPVAHPQAVGPYRLRIWTQWGRNRPCSPPKMSPRQRPSFRGSDPTDPAPRPNLPVYSSRSSIRSAGKVRLLKWRRSVDPQRGGDRVSARFRTGRERSDQAFPSGATRPAAFVERTRPRRDKPREAGSRG